MARARPKLLSKTLPIFELLLSDTRAFKTCKNLPCLGVINKDGPSDDFVYKKKNETNFETDQLDNLFPKQKMVGVPQTIP